MSLFRIARGLAFAVAVPLASSALAQASPSAYMSAARYDAMGRVTGTLAPDPDGAGPRRHAAVRNSYDGSGRLIRVETGELSAWQPESVAPASWSGFTVHRQVDTAYDAIGRRLRETVSSGGTVHALTQYSYDLAGRLECAAVRMNPAIYGSLPASACTLGAQGPHGPDRITRNAYDLAGQRVQVRIGVGTAIEAAEATWAYNLNGQPTAMIDANGNRATYSYDGHGRRLRWTFPSSAAPPSGYNPATQATALATAGPANASDYEQYGYDANGNRTSLRKRDGLTLTFQHDALNRLSVKVVPERAGLAASHTRDVYYGYDNRGLQLRARFDGVNGEGVTNAWDGFGRLVSHSLNMGGVTRTLTYQHDRNGNRTRITHPDGVYFLQSHDQLNRLVNVRESGHDPLGRFGYNAAGRVGSLLYGTGASQSGLGYDGAGRLATLSHDFAGTGSDVGWTFAYNPASQLAATTRSNDAYAWGGHYNVVRNYTANGLNQYTAAGGASFAYDANGNLTSGGGTSYVYDVENRLVAASGAHNATLTYDPLGRLWQVTGGNPSTTTRFLHDGDALVGEYDAAGTMVDRYVHGPGVDAPLAWYGSGGRRYLIADRQGSIVAHANDAGTSIGINSYDEYGILASTNTGRFQYTGQIWLAELGLYHYKARAYSPTLGRFMQTDPIGYEGGVNLYGYVGNDPINYSDPTGLQKDYDDEPLTERVINQAIGAIERIEDARDVASNTASIPGNMAQDVATEAVPDSIYQTDRERQGIDGDYRLYPDYPNLPEVTKVVNTEITHAIARGLERGVFDDSASARSTFSGLKSGITGSRAWPSGTIYDRDGRGEIRRNSVLVPVGNNGYAVYRVRSNGTAVLRTTIDRRP